MQDTGDEDLVRIRNGRLTHQEYVSSSASDRLTDDNNGDYEFAETNTHRLGEDLWYILNEKLEGIDPRGTLKGFKEGGV